MSIRYLIIAAAGVLATLTSAKAGVVDTATFQGSYLAVNSISGPYEPTINDDGGAFLSSPFSGTLTQGQQVTTTFLQVAPVSGGSSVGTISGSVDIAMALTDTSGAAVTSLSASTGGNTAFLSNGDIYFAANYELFYGNQTDCLTWNASSCTPSGNTTTLGEMLTATFADNTVLDIYLYNWSDWDMAPSIGFELVSGPTVTVPEPASFAMFGVGLLGLGLVVGRRGRGGRQGSSLPLMA